MHMHKYIILYFISIPLVGIILELWSKFLIIQKLYSFLHNNESHLLNSQYVISFMLNSLTSPFILNYTQTSFKVYWNYTDLSLYFELYTNHPYFLKWTTLIFVTEIEKRKSIFWLTSQA